VGSDLIALTRDVSAGIARCELTHLARVPIDLDRARAQHDAYETALTALGCRVERLRSSDDMPDSVFIEDVAIVVDELAVVTRPGAESRRAELPAVEQALALRRPIARIEPPGTLDGGDVLVVGREVFVGQSGRTNREAIDQLGRLLRPFEYQVHGLAVTGCLHLKSAVTLVRADCLLLNPAWIARNCFSAYECLEVDAREPYGANALLVSDAVVYPSAHPRTRERLVANGVKVTGVDVSELAKAEGAVTCCSVIFKS